MNMDESYRELASLDEMLDEGPDDIGPPEWWNELGEYEDEPDTVRSEAEYDMWNSASER